MFTAQVAIIRGVRLREEVVGWDKASLCGLPARDPSRVPSHLTDTCGDHGQAYTGV
jgi:hypothetical protein